MLTVANSNIVHRASQANCRAALKLARFELQQTCIHLNYEGRPFWNQIPRTLPTLYHILNLESELKAALCCPQCYALHRTPYPANEADFKLKCDNMQFFESPTKVTRGQPKPPNLRRECDALLYTNSRKKAERIFYHHSLRQWLARMMLLPGFEDKLDASLNRQGNSLHMLDIWDGQLWKTFEHSVYDD